MKQFRLHAPAQAFDGLSTKEAQAKLQSLLRSKLPCAQFTLVDTARLASKTLEDGSCLARFLLFVGTLEEAESLVSARCALKGSAFCLHDVLSPEEHLVHNTLWPRFTKAQRQGIPAQFRRARLFVSGVEVLPDSLGQ